MTTVEVEIVYAWTCPVCEHENTQWHITGGQELTCTSCEATCLAGTVRDYGNSDW